MMTIKIIETRNDGFSNEEIDLITKSFIANISEIELEIESDKYFDLIDLDNSKVIMIISFKKFNNRRIWEAKIFSDMNSLKIIADDDLIPANKSSTSF